MTITDEGLIKKLTLYMVELGTKEIELEKELRFHIIKFLNCDVETSQKVIEDMNELGLKSCLESGGFRVNIFKFADMRHYLSPEELGKISAIHRRRGSGKKY